MRLASRSAIESDNSANAGSKVSMGDSDTPPTLDFPDSRNEDRDDGRRGVVGRDVWARVREVERFVLPSIGVVENDMMSRGN